MNLPFISSPDSILQESELPGVSPLLRRALVITKLAEPMKKREIMRFGYSETFYLWSTNGKQYEKYTTS